MKQIHPVQLPNIEGMILLSELSRRRIRSINKLIRVGRTEIVVVLRVDKEKGYIDLSKRRVSAEDIQKCEAKYSKSKTVHSIMRHVSETCKIHVEDLYKQFGWDLYRKYNHAHEAFKLIVNNPDQVLADYDIAPDVREALLKNVNRRLTPQAVKIRCDLEVTCFAYAGIEAIKEALRAGKALHEDISIKLVAPPLYVMMAPADDEEVGVALLNKAVETIVEVINSKGGEVNVKSAPRSVSERDDRLLNTLMVELEKQNQEVAGDEPEEE